MGNYRVILTMSSIWLALGCGGGQPSGGGAITDQSIRNATVDVESCEQHLSELTDFKNRVPLCESGSSPQTCDGGYQTCLDYQFELFEQCMMRKNGENGTCFETCTKPTDVEEIDAVAIHAACEVECSQRFKELNADCTAEFASKSATCLDDALRCAEQRSVADCRISVDERAHWITRRCSHLCYKERLKCQHDEWQKIAAGVARGIGSTWTSLGTNSK